MARGLGESYGKMNEMVGIQNCDFMSDLKKWLRLVNHFTRKQFWEFGCILSEATYWMKGNKLCSELPISVGKNPTTEIHRDVHANTDIHRVCCVIYFPHYYYACH